MPVTSQYEIPPYGSDGNTVLGWCLDAQSEGQAWLEAQKPSRGWDGALQMLSDVQGDGASDLSNVGYNKGKRVARELVASLSNFRHEGEFKTVWDNTLYDQAHTLSDLDRHWYRTTYANEQHRSALQYAVGLGTGYLYETWDKHFWSPFKGDIRLTAYSPADVSFVQMPRDHDIQRAYAVIIREEMPINLAKAIYAETNPGFAASLTADRDQPGWLQKGLRKVQQFVSPALRVAGRMSKQNDSSFPTVDIFHMYVMDRTINSGPMPIEMGARGTNWGYTVPAIGDPLPTDTVNTATGNFFTVPATEAECRLFPLRRYVIFSRTGVCYDGSSPWWHGQVPLARIRFNDWAWEALGASLVGEAKTMQDGIVALMRLIEDSAAARLNPAAIYDDTLVDRTWAEGFNPRRAGARAAAPLSQGNPIQFPVTADYYNVPPWIMEWIDSQEKRIDYITGVTDLVAIAKANQIPGADTLEKLMEMAGPIVQDLVRQVEHPLQRLGDWRKAYYFQFYTRPRWLTITGPDGVDIDKQYTPDVLRILSKGKQPTIPEIHQSMDSFLYHVTESGINEIHRMTTKLLYIQLQKAGFPISWWTLARICQIPNFGPPPQGTNTEMERWVAQQRIVADLQVATQAEIQQQAAEQGLMPGPSDGADAGGGGNGGPPQAGKKPEGRPASFNAAPRLESKDGGSRSTISTSR